MNEVKRYDGKIKHVGDGGYVSYTDYAELKARRDALAAENSAMRNLLGATGFESETPATDAYLNSVRAEGVEMVLKNMNLHSDREEYASWFATQLRAGEPS